MPFTTESTLAKKHLEKFVTELVYCTCVELSIKWTRDASHLSTSWIEPRWVRVGKHWRENKVVRWNRCETLSKRNYVEHRPLLYDFPFMSVFLPLAMGMRDGHHIPPSSNIVLKQAETPDPVELVRGISEIVRYPVGFAQIRWLAPLACEWFVAALIMLWRLTQEIDQERRRQRHLKGEGAVWCFNRFR